LIEHISLRVYLVFGFRVYIFKEIDLEESVKINLNKYE